ncbi:MAG: rRNA maturation RNase YbeY [Candidatus Paceibacterota bacterium]|jgi:probable rRNA maturation factor
MNQKINIIKKTPYKIDEKWLKNTAGRIFNLLETKENYECEINLVCQARMKALNKKFRDKDKVTTILSFVASETDDFVLPASKYQYLGEIFLCPLVIQKEAKDLEISTKNHMTRLLLHGILHLLGYSHDSEKCAQKMEKIEEKILKEVLVD